MAEKMPLTSDDIRSEKIARLQEDFPEVFTEGKVDIDRLKETLGEEVATDRERYGLAWAGKSEAIRNIQTPSVATLVPDREESVDFNATANLFIEGDNLKVLKLLQKGYHGQVKMIYIDPPYNTGNEFIYPDNFREGIEDYLRYSGQVSGDGIRISTNTETGGRYHSKWLSMMYPRLFLARNLLREDGVIFVSIDDNEVHNLRMLMNEIFGEENFIATVVWQKRVSPDSDEKHMTATHDYVICYARSKDEYPITGFSRSSTQDERYQNPDDDPRGPWTSSDLTRREYRPHDFYEIELPSGRKVEPARGRSWGVPKETFQRLVSDNRIWFGPNGDSMPRRKRFLSEVSTRIVPVTWWTRELSSDNQTGTREVKQLFPDLNRTFENPKPRHLVQTLATIASEKDSVILDFFSGSGTMAHAILELNKQDSGSRMSISVQLPEPTGDPNYPTIADIGKERIRQVIKKLNDEEDGKLHAEDAPQQDRGFKVFKLTSSNFKNWDGSGASDEPEDLSKQLRAFAENVLDRSREDILYEILLKSGLPLTAKVEQLEVEGREVYAVSGGLLMVCLEDHMDDELMRVVVEYGPERFVCLDTAFDGNDKLKTNTVLQMKDHGIEFRTV